MSHVGNPTLGKGRRRNVSISTAGSRRSGRSSVSATPSQVKRAVAKMKKRREKRREKRMAKNELVKKYTISNAEKEERHAMSLASRVVKERLHREAANPIVTRYLQQTMLPDSASPLSVVVPTGRLTDKNVAFVKLSSTLSVDVLSISKLIQEENTTTGHFVPVNDQRLPIWAVGDSPQLPICMTQDAAYPFCMPVATTNVNSYVRRWIYPARNAFDAVQQTAGTEPQMTFPIVFTGEGKIAIGTSDLPAGFQTRPVFTDRVRSNRLEYIWVDVGGIPAGFSGKLGVTFDFHVTASSPCTFDLSLKGTRISNDGSTYSAFASTGVATTAMEVHSVSMTLDVLTVSGFYTVELAGFQSTGPSLFYMYFDNIQVVVEEEGKYATGFHRNNSYCDSAPSNAAEQMVVSQGTLFSFRAPPLTSAGSIYGINCAALSKAMWYASSTQGLDQLTQVVKPDRQYCGGNGGKLQEGMWCYHSPSEWLPALPTTNEKLGSTGPATAYWVCSPSSNSRSTNMCYIVPDINASDVNFIMNFTTYTLLAISLRTQFISPTKYTVLLPDDNAVCEELLARVVNFAPNDWHSFFNSVAKVASKAGNFIKNGAEWVQKQMPKAVAAAGHAAHIADTVSELAIALA